MLRQDHSSSHYLHPAPLSSIAVSLVPASHVGMHGMLLLLRCFATCAVHSSWRARVRPGLAASRLPHPARLTSTARHAPRNSPMASLTAMEPDLALASQEPGASALNFIYSCSICGVTFADRYEGHNETVQGLSDGINPKDRLVTKLFLSDCCHVFCGEHLEGGGKCTRQYCGIKTEGVRCRSPIPPRWSDA